MQSTIPENNSAHSCSHCAISQLCLPVGVSQQELAQLEALINQAKVYHAGDYAHRQGDEFNKLYAIKSGTLKSVRVDEFGNEHIVAFHLPGELVGLDGIYPEKYSCSVVALDTAAMCEMDYHKLSDLCSDIPSLQKQLFRILSRDMYETQWSTLNNNDLTAEQRVASFINNLSARFEVRGYSATQFQLAMSRQDIANHISLAPETVSRVLKRLKNNKVLDIQNRNISILDVEALNDIIQCQN